ncbi:MAG: UDP-3-O-(3-hydroxymyristoyl)glucosamine N-acyltransferase [Halobacteriovoraceae bacterium]|nr:UDP-3-O-(3-hydroxymyristoyl)glucosamine N-acyltransferase [Halobacteriovoraceae bacterium]|tara:strand:- start:9923 stop:10960 length:1038 start_codon:yes stop_codon:yes gene_type:complete
MKFSDLKLLEPSLVALKGDPDQFKIESISHSDAPQKNTFIFVKSQKFLANIGRRAQDQDYSQTGIVFEAKFIEALDENSKKDVFNQFGWVAKCDAVNKAISLLSKPFYDKKYKALNFQVDGREMGNTSIDPTTRISQNVFIGEHVRIGAHCTIMPGVTILPHVEIADHTIIYPGVVIYPYCKIGQHCRIHANAVIGLDGFGYNFFDGQHHKVWHLNHVVIEDHVEIGSCTTIDCGAFIDTYIKTGTKIDNGVQLAHNVEVGKHVIMCAASALAGSAEVGDYCVFAGSAGVAPNARLGNGVQVGALSMISENAIIEPNTVWAGTPARPLKEWLKGKAVLRKLIKSR